MLSSRLLRLVEQTAQFKDLKVEFHPEPNVLNHLGQVTTLAIQADDSWDVAMAAMLHDIAKNTTDQKKWAQHAHRGAMLIASDVNAKIQWLVSQHMRAIDYRKGTMRPHKREALQSHYWFEDLMRLHEYDTNGREGHGKHMPWPEIYGWLNERDERVNTVIVMVGVQASGKSTVSNGIVDATRDTGDWWKL